MEEVLSGKHIDITVVEAELVRIFDSLKPTQDVFVQLACGLADGTEQVVGRTEVCKNGNLRPQWNERFNWDFDGSCGGRTLKFTVQIGHTVRKEVLCGEAEFDLATLCNRAASGPQDLRIPLFKRDEQTGRLRIGFSLGEGPAPVAGPALAASPSSDASTPTRGVRWLQACGAATPVGEPQARRRAGDGGGGSSCSLGDAPTAAALPGATPGGRTRRADCFGGTPISEPQAPTPGKDRGADAARAPASSLASGASSATEASRRQEPDEAEREAAAWTAAASPCCDPPAYPLEVSPQSHAVSSEKTMSDGAEEKNVEFWDSFIERG
ncbi:unnamed protein product [Prorocentrum cordatum]|uniref:C2 domain-containing protein n=1 Tax=Prorocentrum cordatum TaxID=2364126 RepID=A0ABN9SSX3_9DINO|nr:unnamed protein product [Polarella glacialis]